MNPPRPLPLHAVEQQRLDAGTLADRLKNLRQKAAASPPGIWIHLESEAALSDGLARSRERLERGQPQPLHGVPFSVKDNIDVAGLPTTAGCPAFSYVAERSAPVVERLLDAGAVVLGKTNLDQFATGLSGTRSPYGVCRNAYDPDYISGGSSSGSAVAVALGLGCFSLATDTAGSGRVPAGLNNIVGLKPTRGALSTRGVVPACRSLDTVAVFAATCADARVIFEICAGFDGLDPFSRKLDFAAAAPGMPLRLGVPRAEDLEFFGDPESERLYRQALARFKAIGASIVDVDLGPFLEAARLLYEGPWVAERLHAVGQLLGENPAALHPTIRQIVSQGLHKSALDAFRGHYRLAELRRASEPAWQHMDYLLVPTTPTTWSIEQMLAEPVLLNSRLGHYTNFVNLFDLSALALPAGFRAGKLPLGVTLIARAGADLELLHWGQRFLGES